MTFDDWDDGPFARDGAWYDNYGKIDDIQCPTCGYIDDNHAQRKCRECRAVMSNPLLADDGDDE